MSEETRSRPSAMYIDIGKKITCFRKDLSLSQTELAGKIGISQTHLASIEIGVRRISLEDLFKVAEALKVSVITLLPIDEVPKKPGPRPKLAVTYDKLLQLPEKDQNIVVAMVESLSNATTNQDS